jgi:hypothetical protein
MESLFSRFLNSDYFKRSLCPHGALFKEGCPTCMMVVFLCINHYDRQLPWLPKDICKLIFAKIK